MHTSLLQPGLPDTIMFFHKHICEEVEVRYALVNRHGISGYSPPYNLYIQGGRLSLMVAYITLHHN